jgi:RimJ/RimL family protein N-acetyltransferase
VTTLATGRLVLRPLVQADADFILELLNDPGWIANIGERGVRTLEAAQAYIRDRFGPNGWFVATDHDGRRLGVCGVLKREQLDRPDLGYAFLQRHAGRGYATEAAAAVLRHAREVMGLASLAAITKPDNRASRRVLEKIGFAYAETRDLPGIGPSACYVG